MSNIIALPLGKRIQIGPKRRVCVQPLKMNVALESLNEDTPTTNGAAVVNVVGDGVGGVEVCWPTIQWDELLTGRQRIRNKSH